MEDSYFSALASEVLDTFAEIARVADAGLSVPPASNHSLVLVRNTWTDNNDKAYENLLYIQRRNREVLERLRVEPAIARLVVETDDQSKQVIYISRTSIVSLPLKKMFASYLSPVGRLAEFLPGEEADVQLPHGKRWYRIIEKSGFRPVNGTEGWDSCPTRYGHFKEGVYSIDSLRVLLHMEDADRDADELDRILQEHEARSNVIKGVRYQVRTAMKLRDQPILDKFQGEIFRLPLVSQLFILGPPGTGKTTTLIKRLAQKLDLDNLNEDERSLAEKADQTPPHHSSWLMFTPSDLLKHYLKEAFNREQVPASDNNIRTWLSFRNDMARNTLDILRSTTGGKFTYRSDPSILKPGVTKNVRAWYEAFQKFHENRLRQQLLDGLQILSKVDDSEQDILQWLKTSTSRINMVDIYRSLDRNEKRIREHLQQSKSIADDLLKKERNLLYNRDKGVFNNLAKHLETLKQDNEPDDEEMFDDEQEETTAAPDHSSIQTAVNAYFTALKTLARNTYQKRNMAKSSRSASVIQFLGARIPSHNTLQKVGRHISFQNGLRRFINSHKRYVTDIPNSYQQFRKSENVMTDFYSDKTFPAGQITDIELDAVVLLTLQNARLLLKQNFVAHFLNDGKYSYLSNIAESFRNQIMVDEATDFSMLELACMTNLTSLDSQSFFACGDFNQSITATGIRDHDELKWILPSLSIKTIRQVYRQSRELNDFATRLLRNMKEGHLDTLGQVPDESNHQGSRPVLYEHATDESAARWIAERIKEVEHSVQQLPTIAVLVNSEQEVKPTAERLSSCLEEVNLSAAACEQGKVLGEGTEVRVFDVQHIKGLEFEAVFFVGIDRLAQEKPVLFERYLYVGATRAATYLGLVCYEGMPHNIESLRECFDSEWST